MGGDRILFVPDVYGWAFDNIARGLKKHSRFPCDIKSYSDLALGKSVGVDTRLLRQYGVVVYMSWYIPIKAQNWVGALGRKECPFILAHWGHDMPDMGFPLYRDTDAIILGERKLYEKIKSMKWAPTYLLTEGIDTEFFRPIKRPPNRFNVGWAGNYQRANKRTHLLKQLKYPVKIQANHGSEYWVKNRDQSEMVRFYDSLDAYVYVSTNEGGQSTTILEAMASGLPVVTTNAGSETRNLIDDDWVLPVNPPENVVKFMNHRLDRLRENPTLRAQVGTNNRVSAEKRAWQNKAEEFDKIIEKFC